MCGGGGGRNSLSSSEGGGGGGGGGGWREEGGGHVKSYYGGPFFLVTLNFFSCDPRVLLSSPQISSLVTLEFWSWHPKFRHPQSTNYSPVSCLEEGGG